MNVQNKGIPEWVMNNISPVKPKKFMIARVSGVYKSKYSVLLNSEELFAELAGKLLFNIESPLDYPTVGDWVYVQFFNQSSLAIIHEIVPRKTFLKRKIAGKKIAYQLIAANVDIALIIQSLDQDFNIRRLERYIAISREGSITPVILLSKSDLLSRENIEHKIADILSIMPDLQVIAFSNLDNYNFLQITSILKSGKTFCLMGSSGVGKTTLLNHILERNEYKTREVRKDGKGKHTTSNRQLIRLINGSTIIDTPGMRELGLTDSVKGIKQAFREITGLASQCQFNNCTHTVEKGCAVLEALANGIISRNRYENFIKIKKESDFYGMSYAQKRKKDRQKGKLYKNILKNHNKRNRL